ncbi:MAG: four helix bundle protein [Niabella sp.]|nr:four helix bundle protein [Niabella sp.]
MKTTVIRNDKENVIVDKTISFSLAIIKYCEVLEQKRKYVIAKQVLRSATSIGANVFEAQNAESKADFIHKMKIAAKEASESMYWLILCEKSDGYHFDVALRSAIEEIIRILSKIISSSKGKIPGFIWSLLYAFSNLQIIKLTN